MGKVTNIMQHRIEPAKVYEIRGHNKQGKWVGWELYNTVSGEVVCVVDYTVKAPNDQRPLSFIDMRKMRNELNSSEREAEFLHRTRV